MSNLITAPDIVTEWGIQPITSTYTLHPQREWDDFCRSRNSNPTTLEGTYLPRTLSAHLKEQTPFLQLNVFHEYVGHGGFCEHSGIGRRIVRYEQELAEIEKQILEVDELPDGLHFRLDASNPFFDGYARLRDEYANFFRTHHNYYEGFSYWLEHHLAKLYGFSEVSEEKRRKIIHQHHLQLSAAFDEFISKNSIQALLEKLGFI